VRPKGLPFSGALEKELPMSRLWPYSKTFD